MDDTAAVQLLTGAVAIPSVSGEEAGLARWLQETLAPHVDESRVDEAGNIVATIGTGPLRLYCLGHIDTVPGDVPVRVLGGEVWGRGSVDAKGSFCSHAAGIIRAFASDPGLRDRLSVSLIGAVGEESPHSAGARHVLNTMPVPHCLLIGEPSGWQSLTLGYKGQLRLGLTVSRPEAHSAGRHASAADCLLAVCAALQAATERLTADSGADQFNRVQMTVSSLNSSSDGLEQIAQAAVTFRLPPAVTATHAERNLRVAAAAVIRDALDVKLQVRSNGGLDAVVAQKDSLLSRCFRRAIRQQGGRPAFKVKTGTSDMNVVAPSWRVPVLAYGPGDSALDHTPEERVLISEYLAAVRVTATAVQLLAES